MVEECLATGIARRPGAGGADRYEAMAGDQGGHEALPCAGGLPVRPGAVLRVVRMAVAIPQA